MQTRVYFGPGLPGFKNKLSQKCVLLVVLSERQRNVTESKIFCGNETIKENVDTLANTERHGDDTVSAGSSPKAADEIGEVIP